MVLREIRRRACGGSPVETPVSDPEPRFGGASVLTGQENGAYILVMNEALIARGGVPVSLDRQRIVFFDKTASFQLLEKYGEGYLGALYGAGRTEDGKPTVKLKDVDALEYFLWAGLQEDARLADEKLDLKDVSGWFMPSTTMRIFDAVIIAITRDIHTPPLPGKALAATASPAAAAKKRASTSRKRSASRSPSSGKRRKSSGPRR